MNNNYIFPFLWMRDQSEEVLRTEIEKIYECGIRAICLESRPHPDFIGEGWWRDFDVVMEEAKKRDMKIWILDDAHFPTGQANGMILEKYPELARKYIMMQHTDCVGPVKSATLDVNLMMTKQFTWLDFGKKIEKPLIDKQELLSVVAVKVIEGNTLENEVVDLTSYVENGLLKWDVPAGVWRICISFTTYDFGARNEYINYVDEKSVHTLIEAIYEPHFTRYKEEFGKTIAGFFSDEPGFYNVEGFDMNDSIGRKKMALPWSDEMQSVMDGSEHKKWRTALVYLWMDAEDEKKSAYARKVYMELVSEMYAKNFSRQLGKWCEDHDVEYIGHVIEDNGEHNRLGCGTGHYFRAMSGQHMAGIDTIGGQIIPGNAYASRHGIAYVGNGEFYHFGLAKLGASDAQTDPKKKGRLMCEAFGAYGWNFGVKSMKWVADFLLAQGVNHFVPHAFSMADYPDMDCPPHFYARGNNPEFPFFAEVMKYTNRMCDLLNGGKNVPQAALLYPAENAWMNDCMQIEVPGRVLQENQVEYEVLSEDLFAKRDYYGTKIENKKLVVNERTMYALILPETKIIDELQAKTVVEAIENELPVFFINTFPEQVAGVGADAQAMYSQKLQQCKVVPLENIADEVKRVSKSTVIFEQTCRNLLLYTYEKEGKRIYFLFNTSLSEKVSTKAAFSELKLVVSYDAMKDSYNQVDQDMKDGTVVVDVDLKPYESLILCFGNENVDAKEKEATEAEHKMDISAEWKVSKAKAIDYPNYTETERMETLIPVSEIAPEFSGYIKYEKEIVLPKTNCVIVKPEFIYEAAEVFVNGQSAGKQMTPPYIWNVSELCTEGINEIKVEVVNTPTRDSQKYPGPFGPEREILEPSGMFGRVIVEYK